MKLHEIAEIQIMGLDEQKNLPEDKEFFIRVKEGFETHNRIVYIKIYMLIIIIVAM